MTTNHFNGSLHFYLQSILATDDDAITVINRDREVLLWNKAAEQTYNIPRSQIVGENITVFFKESDLMVISVLKSEKPVENVYHRPREDKHVFVNASPIYDDRHRLIGAVSIERDITHIVRLNDKLAATSDQLNELRQKVYLKEPGTPFSTLIGKSAAMKRTIQMAVKSAKTDATVLILGESGTGKELCAQAIHEASSRKNGPFVPVNCGAIPHALFESELFGYERGAFSGAEKQGKAGKIELADGGTLFLDEIGELPLDMQVKLLRVLQENVIYRVGGTSARKINIRFIAATNRNLVKMVQEEKFRPDLFYRLNVIQITMPPLRDRLEDIPELVRFFLNQFASQYQMPTPSFGESAMEYLLQYNWPGNIRELRNVIERAMILSETSEIGKQQLQNLFPYDQLPDRTSTMNMETSLEEEKEALEKSRIEQALQKNRGNKSSTARALGISRVSLYKKMNKYGISL